MSPHQPGPAESALSDIIGNLIDLRAQERAIDDRLARLLPSRGLPLRRDRRGLLRAAYGTH